jgi:hypothetical protein
MRVLINTRLRATDLRELCLSSACYPASVAELIRHAAQIVRGSPQDQTKRHFVVNPVTRWTRRSGPGRTGAAKWLEGL